MNHTGALTEQQQHTLTGDIRTHQNFRSHILGNERTVMVYVPPDYQQNRMARYPVLYLQDGQNIFDGATSFVPGQEWQVDETAQALITSGAIEPLIIVAIYNACERRADEYAPTRDAYKQCGGQADLYGRMLVEELKPFIDSHYRTRAGAAHTALGGSSLGGLVTLYLGLRYPQVFGQLVVMSPSVWWDGHIIVRQVLALRARTQQRIWLDVGTHEEREAINDARLLRDALMAKGWRLHDDLNYFEAEGAGHNEAAWARRMDRVLKFLAPRKTVQQEQYDLAA